MKLSLATGGLLGKCWGLKVEDWRSSRSLRTKFVCRDGEPTKGAVIRSYDGGCAEDGACDGIIVCFVFKRLPETGRF